MVALIHVFAVSHSHGSESSLIIASNKLSFMSMLCAFSCPGAISNSGDASSYHTCHIVSALTARSVHLALTLTPSCSHAHSILLSRSLHLALTLTPPCSHAHSILLSRSLHLALTLTPSCSQSTHAHCQCADCALTPPCSQSHSLVLSLSVYTCTLSMRSLCSHSTLFSILAHYSH